MPNNSDDNTKNNNNNAKDMTAAQQKEEVLRKAKEKWIQTIIAGTNKEFEKIFSLLNSDKIQQSIVKLNTIIANKSLASQSIAVKFQACETFIENFELLDNELFTLYKKTTDGINDYPDLLSDKTIADNYKKAKEFLNNTQDYRAEYDKINKTPNLKKLILESKNIKSKSDTLFYKYHQFRQKFADMRNAELDVFDNYIKDFLNSIEQLQQAFEEDNIFNLKQQDFLSKNSINSISIIDIVNYHLQSLTDKITNLNDNHTGLYYDDAVKLYLDPAFDNLVVIIRAINNWYYQDKFSMLPVGVRGDLVKQMPLSLLVRLSHISPTWEWEGMLKSSTCSQNFWIKEEMKIKEEMNKAISDLLKHNKADKIIKIIDNNPSFLLKYFDIKHNDINIISCTILQLAIATRNIKLKKLIENRFISTPDGILNMQKQIKEMIPEGDKIFLNVSCKFNFALLGEALLKCDLDNSNQIDQIVQDFHMKFMIPATKKLTIREYLDFNLAIESTFIAMVKTLINGWGSTEWSSNRFNYHYMDCFVKKVISPFQKLMPISHCYALSVGVERYIKDDNNDSLKTQVVSLPNSDFGNGGIILDKYFIKNNFDKTLWGSLLSKAYQSARNTILCFPLYLGIINDDLKKTIQEIQKIQQSHDSTRNNRL